MPQLYINIIAICILTIFGVWATYNRHEKNSDKEYNAYHTKQYKNRIESEKKQDYQNKLEALAKASEKAIGLID